MEIWKPAPGMHETIEVSNLGRIRRKEYVSKSVRKHQPTQIRRAVVFSPYVANNGYLQVSPKTGGKRPKYSVHRIVALAFVPGFKEDLSVNHKDGNKLNNHADNLEWVTLAENTKHEWRTGLVDLRGEKQPGHKLKTAQVLAIRDAMKNGARPKDLAKIANVSESAIYLIHQRKRWAHI